MHSFRRTTAVLTAVCIVSSGLLAPAYATTISTEQLAAATAAAVGVLSANHQRLHAALDRTDLAAALQARGVSVEALRDRVDALTDAEAAQVLAQIDQAPAGGDVLGIIFTVFIVLLVTDILGVTKVFPFTRSAR
jgi:hypothetical protein